MEPPLRTLHGLGADLATTANRGKTPAHHAARNGLAAASRVLHGMGVDLATDDNDGKMLAHYAALNEQEASVMA